MTNKKQVRFDITNFNRIIGQIAKLEAGGTYVIRMKSNIEGRAFIDMWKNQKEKPDVKLIVLPHDTDIWTRK